MESGHAERNVSPAGEQPAERKGYPTNHVLGVVDTDEQAARTVEALTAGGFLDSEIRLAAGQAEADALHARTGRRGLANVAIRIAERLGIADDEMEVKAGYEQALREGRFLLLVEAPTDARKARAAQILHEHGAHTVNFMGRFAMEELARPHVPESES